MGFRLKRAPRCAPPSVLTFADSSAVSSLKGSAQTLPEIADAELLANTRLTVWKSNLQPDFNVSVCDRFDARLSAMLRELDESDRFVQESAESTSM